MKDSFISYRAGYSDVKALEELAKLFNMPKSEVIRFLVRREIEDHKILTASGDHDPVLLASQLRIGGL